MDNYDFENVISNEYFGNSEGQDLKDLKDLIIGIMKEIENLKIFVGKIVKDKYVNKM